MTLKTKEVRLSPRGDDSRSIDHGSRHVHIDPGWILGKAVKNAHDAYLAVEPEQLDREKLERAVVISRQRHTNGTSRLFIEDNGVGRLFTNLRRDVRPGMRGMNREPYRVKNAASLHDICSWALGAGSKVAIESTIRGVAMRSRLEINVRCIHEKMRVDSLERVLTDPECISVSVDECDPTDHERC